MRQEPSNRFDWRRLPAGNATNRLLSPRALEAVLCTTHGPPPEAHPSAGERLRPRGTAPGASDPPTNVSSMTTPRFRPALEHIPAYKAGKPPTLEHGKSFK